MATGAMTAWGATLPSYFIYTHHHWQQRASEMRLLAAGIEGQEAQETMLRIAEHYERLAAKAQPQVIAPRAKPPAHADAAPELPRSPAAPMWPSPPPEAQNPAV